MELNDEQLKAIDHKNGPLLVVAGAGTGKTKVIVERFAKLIDSGVDKNHILVLTFTEKATQEMIDRVSDKLVGSYGVELNIHTFNGFGQEMLREFAVEIGLSPNLKLIGENGRVVLLKEYLDTLKLDYFAPISNPDSQLGVIADYFSELKQQLISPSELAEYAANMPTADDVAKLECMRQQELAYAYERYIELCRKTNIIDYDDQIYLLVELLRARPNIRKKLQDRYTHIMVDEFQDTNPMQSELIHLLAGDKQNVFAVGDDDQSIYGWRGATLSNILEFQDKYPGSKNTTLIKNYRSTQNILDAGYSLIQQNNPDRLEVINKLDKKLIADNGSGEAPEARKFPTLADELDWIARDIKQKIASGHEPGKIAVLARGKRTVRRAGQFLQANGVEHSLVGVNESLYAQPIISSMLEALYAIADPSNNNATYHTLSGPLFNIDVARLRTFYVEAGKKHQTLEQTLEKADDTTVKQALEKIEQWRSSINDVSLKQLAYRILDESGLLDRLRVDSADSIDALRSVKALGEWFETFSDFEKVSINPTTIRYLESLDALKAEGDFIDADDADPVVGKPVVTTCHSAKGLEWTTVYVVNCVERSFPYLSGGKSLKIPEALLKSSRADSRLAEERRLMYVAVTRAEENLILSYSESVNGTSASKPSRFIGEMDDHIQHDGPAITESETPTIIEPIDAKIDEVALPASMFSGEHLKLTASQVDDYLRCPLNFFYKHVAKMPEKPTPSTTIGTLFHELLQDINESKLADKPLPPLKKHVQTIKAQWPEEGFGSKMQRDRALKESIRGYGEYYETASHAPAPQAIEYPFTMHVPDSKLILTGRIDAVMPGETGPQIVDYKTSIVQTPEKAKERTQKSKQLEMYGMVWLLEKNEVPESVSLDFILTGQMGVVKKKKKTFENMQQKLAEVADNILAKKFPQAGNRHEYCLHPIID